MKAELNRNFFNQLAPQWDNRVNHNDIKISFLLDRLALNNGDCVLDVGTGTGVMLPFLLERIAENGSITAIDVAENMIAEARAKFPSPNIHFVIGNVFTASLSPASYDAIICYSVFPHLEGGFETVRVLASLLKAEGKLMICHSESRETINNRHQELGKSLISNPLPPVAELVAAFAEAGLAVTEKSDNAEMYYIVGYKKTA